MHLTQAAGETRVGPTALWDAREPGRELRARTTNRYRRFPQRRRLSQPTDTELPRTEPPTTEPPAAEPPAAEPTQAEPPITEPPRPTETEGSRRRWIGRGLLVVGVLILLSAGWVGFRTYQAYRHLNAAADQVSALQAQVNGLANIDLSKAGAAVAALRIEADDAVSATTDPLYRLAGHLPWLGPNLQAVTSIAVTVDSLATKTAPALIEVAKTLQPSLLAPKNGTIDVALSQRHPRPCRTPTPR